MVEISKSLLLGKRGDNVDTIKYAFTRLSFTLKEYDILEKFGEREAPIFQLDHMLNNTTPNKPTFYCGLGLKKKIQHLEGITKSEAKMLIFKPILIKN